MPEPVYIIAHSVSEGVLHTVVTRYDADGTTTVLASARVPLEHLNDGDVYGRMSRALPTPGG